MEAENLEKVIEKLGKTNGETFQIISSEGDILRLKGESTGQDIKVSLADLFYCLEKGLVNLKNKPVPEVKVDGRKRKIAQEE